MSFELCTNKTINKNPMWANKFYDNFLKLPIHNRQALFGRGGEKKRHLATTSKRKKWFAGRRNGRWWKIAKTPRSNKCVNLWWYARKGVSVMSRAFIYSILPPEHAHHCLNKSLAINTHYNNVIMVSFYDQNLQFSLPYLWPDQNGWKTMHFGAAHTYIG